MGILSSVRRDAGHLLNRPSLLLRLRRKSSRQRLVHLVKARLFQSTVSEEWVSDENSHLQNREYDSYEQYLEHQKLKIGFLNLKGYDQEFRETLRGRLQELDIVKSGSRVLCLAARVGTEVKAFCDVGCFAVGIDLNPGTGNRFVLHGDFHDLQFPDNCVDIVYTNSLDHAFDIEKIVNEVKRVLCPGGTFLVEAIGGRNVGIAPDQFESFWWDSVDDLVVRFQQLGFELQEQKEFTDPWKGVQLQLSNAS